jgi:hypothetical protein
MKKESWDFDFEKVKEHLETLPDTISKIKYLMLQIKEYRQAKDWVDWDKHKVYFDKQCEMEIKVLKEIASMDNTPSEKKESTHLQTPPLEILINDNAPIKWTGTSGQLVYLFELLREKDFLPTSLDLQATIKKHFVDSRGKTFTSLKQSKQNYLNSKTGKPQRADELEKLTDKTKENE